MGCTNPGNMRVKGIVSTEKSELHGPTCLWYSAKMKPWKLVHQKHDYVLQRSEKCTSEWIYHTHFPPCTAVLE